MISRACVEVWSSAWEWLKFFDECEKRHPGEIRPAAKEFHTLYLTTVSSLGRDTETLSAIKSTPGVRVLITKSWISVLDDAQTAGPLFGSLCNFLLVHMNFKDPRTLKEIIEGAGGTVADLATLIVKHIRCAAPTKMHTVSDEDGFALLAISMLIDNGLFDDAMTDALLAAGIVQCVTTAICALCGPAMEVTEQMIPLFITMLARHLSRFPGFPWVKEALDAGLLRAVMLSASRRAPVIDVTLLFIVSERLPESLVYHSVLSSLPSALEDAKDIAATPQFRGSPLFRKWTDFVDLAAERLEVMTRFDRGELGESRACDNLEVRAILFCTFGFPN